MPSPFTDRPNADNSGLGRRLDSWKEIASYLGRGERTVKRWETMRGLPLHRVPGAGRATVYAFTAELDEWLQSRKAQQLEPVEEDEEDSKADEPSAAATEGSAVPIVHLLKETAPRPESKPGWKFALAAMLAAGVIGAVAFAAARPAEFWMRHGIPAMFSRGRPTASRPAAPVVSETDKREARDLYLKGRYEWGQRTPDSLNRALDSFTQAIVHDPGYAQAYAGLADTYDLLEVYSVPTMPERDAYPRAIAAARKAVELDDSLAEAHRALAFAEFYGGWDFVDSEKEFRRAIELNPKDAVARRWYANAFAMPGRMQESLDQFDKAQELDPSSHSTLSDKAIILYQAGRQQEGIALLKEVERTDPGFYSPHFYLMNIALLNRDYPAYLDEGRRAGEIANDPVLKSIVAAARRGFERDGERGLLGAVYAKQREYYLAGNLAGGGTVLAKTCIMMGKRQEALTLLEDAYAHHDVSVLWSLVQPDLLTLRDEPRYQALVKEINFPQSPQKPSTSPPREPATPPLQTASNPH